MIPIPQFYGLVQKKKVLSPWTQLRVVLLVSLEQICHEFGLSNQQSNNYCSQLFYVDQSTAATS